MILATHGLVGAAIVKLMPGHPVLGALLAFASHFALDAIPHWQYKLESLEEHADHLRDDMRIGRKFIKDLGKISLDAFAGLALSLFLFRGTSPWLIVLGVGAAILPDALQFAYFKIRRQPFTALQRLHILIHSKNRDLENRPVLGPAAEAGILAVILYILAKL